jgi:transcriptional regulator with XRE-family HTH domain
MGGAIEHMRKTAPRTAVEPDSLGRRVRVLRTSRGLSQDRVSLGANVDQSGYSKFERGVRGLGHAAIRRVAEVLGVPFDELVRGTDFDARGGQTVSKGTPE